MVKNSAMDYHEDEVANYEDGLLNLVFKDRKPSPHTILVLALFLKEGELYGYQITKKTGIKSGTLYVILSRLSSEEYGILEGEWVGMDKENESQRPRRLYRLTPKGRQLALSAVLADAGSRV